MPASDAPSEPLIYALVDLTFELANQTNALIVDLLAQLDLTTPLANALWQLDPAASTLSMRELAARLNCDPSTVTFLADRLEDRKLLVRRIDPKNRRVKLLVLTPKGRQARQTLVDGVATRSPVAHLSISEQQRLRRLLVKALQVTASSNTAAELDSGPVVRSALAAR